MGESMHKRVIKAKSYYSVFSCYHHCTILKYKPMKKCYFKILECIFSSILALSSIAPAQDMAKVKQAADKGNPNAMYILAKRLEEKGEYQEALSYFNKAGLKGHASAMAMLAHYIEFYPHYFAEKEGQYDFGWELSDEMRKIHKEISLRRYIKLPARYFHQKSLDEHSVLDNRNWIAFMLYQNAAKKGSRHAMFRIGNYYLSSKKIILPAWLANGYWSITREKKTTKVKGDIGYFYKEKWHIDKDVQKSLSWFMQGVKKGDPECIFQVAMMYKRGIGVKTNTAKYIEYLEEAAKRGYIPAMLTLSRIYRVGSPIKKDTAKADQLLIDALKKNPSARDLDTIMNTQEAVDSMLSAYRGEVDGIDANEKKASFWQQSHQVLKMWEPDERYYGRNLTTAKIRGNY